MITIVFTESHLMAYGVIHTRPSQALVSAELAGRDYPMTSTFHVFLNTLINRYKEYNPKSVRYPIEINVVFPTQSYYSKTDRKHLLDYILDRSDVIVLGRRKSFMEAVIRGWLKSQKIDIDTWIGIESAKQMTLGVKVNRTSRLLIKNDPHVGNDYVLESLKIWSSQLETPQIGYLMDQIEELDANQVSNIFSQNKLTTAFPESLELPNETISVGKELVLNILEIESNRIFLHINNYNSKLPELDFVFIFGSFTDNEVIHSSLREKTSNSNYRTVFLPNQSLIQLAVKGMQPVINYPAASTDKALSTQTDDTTTSTIEDDTTSSQETSQHIPLTKPKTNPDAKALGAITLFSDEFIVQKRIPDQEFMLFEGHRKGIETAHFYRYVDHQSYKNEHRAAAFMKVARKERKMYPDLGSIVNGRSGRYYILPNINAKPLEVVVKQSRLHTKSEKSFKSEDFLFILDLYKAVKALPVTFKNLTARNIYVRRRDWWRRNSQNEYYFLGVTAEDSSISHMITELDKLLQSLIHPIIIDHITNFKNEI